MGKFFCFMKSKITVSKHCHFFSSVKKCVTYCAVADTFSLKFLYSRNPGRSSPASGCQNHAACLKISCGSFHLKSIKTTHSHNLGIQDPYASWGNLLSEAMQIGQLKFRPWVSQNP